MARKGTKGAKLPPPVSFRLSRELADALDLARAQIEEGASGVPISTADALRVLLKEAIEARGIAVAALTKTK